jgi:hypothetical protein
VGTNSQHLEDETLVYSLDTSSEPAVSPEAIVSSLREIRGALKLASGITSEENSTVEAFLETLRGMEVLISQISINPSLFLGMLGPVEDARINAEGILIITSPEGGIETVDLTSFDNRDLLVSILGDLVEKLKEVAKRTRVLTEIPGDESDIEMAFIDMPVIEEPPEIEEIAEPESPEEVVIPIEELDEPEEEQFSLEPELVEPHVEEFSPPLPQPIEEEPPTIPRATEEAIATPTILKDSALRRFRARVRRQRGETSRSISKIRKLREAQIERMRTGAIEPWIQEEGVLASLKKLLFRRARKT